MATHSEVMFDSRKGEIFDNALKHVYHLWTIRNIEQKPRNSEMYELIPMNNFPSTCS
jgi:hypothetical protein